MWKQLFFSVKEKIKDEKNLVLYNGLMLQELKLLTKEISLSSYFIVLHWYVISLSTPPPPPYCSQCWLLQADCLCTSGRFPLLARSNVTTCHHWNLFFHSLLFTQHLFTNHFFTHHSFAYLFSIKSSFVCSLIIVHSSFVQSWNITYVLFFVCDTFTLLLLNLTQNI